MCVKERKKGSRGQARRTEGEQVEESTGKRKATGQKEKGKEDQGDLSAESLKEPVRSEQGRKERRGCELTRSSDELGSREHESLDGACTHGEESEQG